MNNWLKLQMAQDLGITANYRFLKPNDLIFHLYTLLGGPFNQVLSAQNLSWLLFKLLGEKEFTEKFPGVSEYYENSGPDRDIRRMGLAEKLGDLFDQYQVYRPEMINQWNSENQETNSQEKWQQWLWTKARVASHDSLPDKTLIGTYILKALKDPGLTANLVARLPFLHLFGLSILTAYHIRILYELSKLTDVHFHIINPAPSVYWFDDRSEKQLAFWRRKGFKEPGGQVDNPEENRKTSGTINGDQSIHDKGSVILSTPGNVLLTGWGRVIQDSFRLFFQQEDFLNAYEEVDILPPEKDTLLHKIQSDIFNAATDDRNPVVPADITDGSVTINSCYTIAREVEVLYNYLVYLADKKRETLSTRDIVVMVTDIDAYAPFIKAVFSNAPYPFRYTIADESFTGNDTLFNALHALLVMNEENFKAEEVMQLLDFSCIRKRFGLKDVLYIRKIVDAANIRFGLYGNKEEGTHLVSWRYGIQRIMYGICISGEPEYGEGADSFYPLDLLEGSAAEELIRFCHFAEVLMDSVENRKGTRTIAEWVSYVEELLRDLVFEPAEDTDQDYDTLIKHLAGYNVLNEYMQDEVAFEVFSHSFLQMLAGNTRSGLFVNGGITFCSLIPMRSIPFKVVALLGLNFDQFPRREQTSGFNLMEQKRELGDRNIRENDKHLFLETILSARQYLYMSYVGQSPNDNTILPPSALIDELIDYIEAGTEDPESVRKQLITRQPLHGFSRLYTRKDQRLYSYLNVPSARPVAVINKEKVKESFRFEEIQLDDLLQFFKNPFKFYYNKVLGIYYSDEQVLLSDTEIFSLDSLQSWNLKNVLLPASETKIVALPNELQKKGTLPLGNIGPVVMQQVEEIVDQARDLYLFCTGDRPESSVPIELKIGENLLTGTLPGVFDGKLVQASWSKNETKYLVEAYIRYLAGSAAGVISGWSFISFTLKKVTFYTPVLPREEALSRLAELIKIYRQGFETILPFYPDFKTDPGKITTLDFAVFTAMVNDSLNNFNYSCDDPYIMREYHNGYFEKEDLTAVYQHICGLVILPFSQLFPDYYAKK
jgi:exodeoxyribonuclease V gamma subunit